MDNMMNDELHNYEPTCEELYPADFNHSEYKEWIDSTGSHAGDVHAATSEIKRSRKKS